MTFKNLLCVAAAAALMTSQAMAQGTGTTSSNGPGTNGPTITIDFLRPEGGGAPIIDPVTGGLTYIVSVTPDTDQPVFTEAGDGPNGQGASLGLELGLILRGGLSSDATPIANDPNPLFPDDAGGQIVVNTNLTDFGNPGLADDNTADEGIDAGIVDFANPGNPIFGFEQLNFDTNDADSDPDQVVGIQVSTVGDAMNTIDFSAIDDGNFVNDVDVVIFGGLGTTFISESSIGTGAGQAESFEVLRIKGPRLDTDIAATLSPELIVVGGSIAAQSTNLDDPTDPQSVAFTLPETSDSDTILPGDVNLDGTVDINDVGILFPFFNQPVTNGWLSGDINDDDIVDINDVGALFPFFNQSAPEAPAVASAVGVPEPTAVLILGVGLAGLSYARRRV